jgi:hypothetical protein
MAAGTSQALPPAAAAAKERGTQAFRKGDFAQAVKAYSEALAITPEDHTLLSNRSAAYGSLEQFQEACSDATECTRLRPDWPKGYARLGFALFHLGRLDESINAYETGLKLDPPADVTKTLSSGLQDVKEKRKKAAEEDAEEAAKKEEELRPGNRREGMNHKPAWQTRGIGINEEIFGETRGDLMKPGLTKADMERLEKAVPTGPDPFGDVFREAAGAPAAPSQGVMAGTPKASFPVMLETSKASGVALMAAMPKAYAAPLMQAVPKRSIPFKVASKALATAPWRQRKSPMADGLIPPPPGPGAFKKAGPPLPFKARASMKAASDAVEDEDEAEYDPFSEAPIEESDAKAKAPLPFKAPPAKGARVKAKAIGAASTKSIGAVPPATLQAAPPRGPPAKRVRRAYPKVVGGPAKAKADAKASSASPEDAAAIWLSKKGGRTSRVDKAAALAQEYFVHSKEEKKDEPEAKRQKTEAEFIFGQEVLDKTPDNMQTIRSLLQFLEKKLQAESPAAPEVTGPQDLHVRLRSYADKFGRLTGIRATSGWDARAKRVLDIPGATKAAAAGVVLESAEKDLAKNREDLEKELKDKDSLDACVEKRLAWAKDRLRHDWLLWCARLLRAREEALTKALEAKDGKEVKQTNGKASLSYVSIIEALLAGGSG